MNTQEGRGFTTAVLKEHSRKELVDLLDSVRGKKGLVIDPTLSGPLSLVAEFSLLKEHGVEKIYHLAPGRLDTDCKSLIYICRPHMNYMRFIADHIRTHSKTTKLEYTICFVPRRTLICERLLEEEGVYGDVTIREYHLDIISLEDDLLSLELENSFREVFVDGDTTSIFLMAKAVMKLQTVFGIVPHIVGKGYAARRLADLLLRMRKELQANAENEAASSRIFPAGSEIDSIVIIERPVDMITPMCTQLTYEGLIDELFGIRSTFVELDPAIVGQPTPSSSAASTAAPPQSTKPKKVPLNSTDKLYAQLRDLNFTVVGGLLNQVAKRLSTDYEGRHTAKTISELKDFIGRLGNLQAEHVSLRMHTNIAERISKYTSSPEFDKLLEAQQNFVAGIMNKAHLDQIEELVDKQSPLMSVLRLQCLYSLVEGGIKAKVYDSFRKDIVQTYGYPHILTLQNLARAGLLRKQDSSTPKHAYPAIRKAFKLIVDDVNEHKPNDVSYVYSGYAPLSIRLVQIACQKDPLGPAGVTGGGEKVVSWKGWEEPLRLLHGPTFEETQKADDGVFGKRSTSQQKVTLVVFLGGCTHTEVSALRFLSMQDPLREYVILTTNMTNGTTLLDSLVAKVDIAPLSSGA